MKGLLAEHSAGRCWQGVDLATVTELAAKILDLFRKTVKSKGEADIAATSLYKEFEGEGPHEMIQDAIRYLLDRDFIAPHSYSLTAKGMVKRVGSEESTT